MNKRNHVLELALLVSILLYTHTSTSFIPEQTIVFGQVSNKIESVVNTTVEFGIFIKNYFNYTVTGITVSLNLTEDAPIEFVSCTFGELTGDNITLNTTMLSPEVGVFDAVNITYGYMTSSYLEYNVSQIAPNEQMIFFYNITSDIITEAFVPRASMSYYDNWMDLQEGLETERIRVNFVSGNTTHDTNLPYWHIGNTIPTAWGWIILGVVPAAIALVSAFVLYFKRR